MDLLTIENEIIVSLELKKRQILLFLGALSKIFMLILNRWSPPLNCSILREATLC